MFADKQTLKDLEIFKGSEEGLSLFAMLDNTVTSSGSYCLEKRFKNPLTSVIHIIQVQDAIEFLVKNSHNWGLPFSDSSIKSLENYATCNINPLRTSSRVSLVFRSIGYFMNEKFVLSYLRQSLSECVYFTDNVIKYFGSFANQEFPPALLTIREQFLNFREYAPIKVLLEKSSRRLKVAFTDVFYYDGLLRSEYKERLISIIESAYEIDALLSMAKAVVHFNLCRPEIVNNGNIKLEFEQLYHLALKHPVSNDLTIPGNKTLLFLTGPNMAGKTTFLKSVGIAVYLAHIGMYVPARKMRLPFFDRIISGLTVTDNILTGYSYFFSEVRRVKDVAESLNKNEKVIAIFDELFKGTNVKDAYDSTEMIIAGFLNWNNSLFILSSHLSELHEKLSESDGICFNCFDSEIREGIPSFSFRLMSGISSLRLGTTIIRNENILNMLSRRNNPAE